MPLVSVLLPVRNAAPWLSSSLRSLWRQEWRDFEVIAVDDGSTDGSGEALERAAAREPRLRVVRTAGAGLPAALGTALALARGTLVARHDADDLSHRERFAAQVAWLDAHPGCDVVGSRVRLFPRRDFGAGMARWERWHNALLEDEEIRRELLIDSPVAHGCVTLRREALERAGGWQEHGWAEDLDLWLRLAATGARFAKLPRVLYGWRQHARSSTRTDGRYAIERFTALKVHALDRDHLASGETVTLVGVGRSLERWRGALGARVARVIEARRPLDPGTPGASGRLLLAYMSPEARRDWRAHLTARGWTESEHFIFIA